MEDTLAAKLRVLRARRGLTLVDAAKEMGISRDTLSDSERGRRYPHMPTLRRIADFYDVPVEELLGEPALAGKSEAPATGRPEREAPDKDDPWAAIVTDILGFDVSEINVPQAREDQEAFAEAVREVIEERRRRRRARDAEEYEDPRARFERLRAEFRNKKARAESRNKRSRANT